MSDYTDLVAAKYLQLFEARELRKLIINLRVEDLQGVDVRIAKLTLPVEEGKFLYFWGSLGYANKAISGKHVNEFVAIYDTDTALGGEIVAAAFDYDKSIELLGYGHTFPLNAESECRQYGYTTALILDSGLYPLFEDSQFKIDNFHFHFYSVIPITQADLQYKKEFGLDSLLSKWDTEQKDIAHLNFSINQSEAF